MKESAGLMLYRYRGDRLEVLLVHPSGNYNRHAPWSLPKGLPDKDESLAQAAIRETQEEAGVAIAGKESVDEAIRQLTSLGYIDYKRSRKRVHAFAIASPADAAPHPAQWEVDRAEFMPIEEASRLIHPDQRPFLDRLVEVLAKQRQSEKGE